MMKSTAFTVTGLFCWSILGLATAHEYVVQLTSETSLNSFLESNSLNNLDEPVDKIVIGSDFHGFSGEFEDEVMSELYGDPRVASISIDRMLYLQEYLRQNDAPEHLARLSNGVSNSRVSAKNENAFIFHSHAGIGVDVYIVDSGIDSQHPAFMNRHISKLIDLTDNPIPVGDPHGHGTAIAGLVTSDTFGVMKKANLFDVRVVDAESNGVKLSKLLKSLEFIENHSRATMRPSVAVLPFSMSKNAILNSAIESMPNSIAIVVPAGNQHHMACNFSPASARNSQSILSVGSLDYRSSIEIASFSNYGECVDVFTSGVQMDTLHATTNSDENYISKVSGTSMSCAIAAGTVGYYMSLGLSSVEAIEKIKSAKEILVSGEAIKELKLTL
ncbi:hypothetical protein Kpol_2000p69 [Vanderwaltozyma polyspora DSM 70294]|uniref:Peptidase S8/S53 domain-containing protein n=1 Tax=Vanderwaltozyma polyspora (strain ATCC 22028 / DSM 70294 / BCRC 21397 / CBS 2163 / NBRC 10782 / NRRL Y-8283 / UCD 57-17) TaxID=436907 RepID=A7TF76_VANPO|nr:uncharacterized protein Kpol_2000p69 [Vanderwaltozyma polyspora DSM 70294]EDO19101.1 hypothetical protein Kpol_2000p69 [Vanderwaltozyma polyspora DSM 70294]